LKQVKETLDFCLNNYN